MHHQPLAFPVAQILGTVMGGRGVEKVTSEIDSGGQERDLGRKRRQCPPPPRTYAEALIIGFGGTSPKQIAAAANGVRQATEDTKRAFPMRKRAFTMKGLPI